MTVTPTLLPIIPWRMSINMAENTHLASRIPSSQKSLLQGFIGLKIKSMTRFLYDVPESIPVIYGIPAELVFSHFSALLLLILSDDRRFGLQVDTELASVVIKPFSGEEASDESAFFNDAHYTAVDSGDAAYSEDKFAAALHSEITGVHIYTRSPKNAKLKTRPREAGLGLELANGTECIFSCGLHDGSDDFSVIFRSDIPAEVFVQLQIAQIANS